MIEKAIEILYKMEKSREKNCSNRTALVEARSFHYAIEVLEQVKAQASTTETEPDEQ